MPGCKVAELVTPSGVGSLVGAMGAAAISVGRGCDRREPAMKRLLIGVAAAAFVVVGCGGGATPTGRTAAADSGVVTAADDITSLQTEMTNQVRPSLESSARAATGISETATVTSVNCISTGAPNFTCTLGATITALGSTQKWSYTIPAACDATGSCQWFASTNSVQVG